MRDVDDAEWDSILDAADIQCCHRFVRTCQEAGVANATYRHLMVTDGNGLAAVASLSFMQVSLEMLTPRSLRAPVQSVRAVAPQFLRVPVLFCGLPVSFGQPCMKLRASADSSAIVRKIHNVMDDVGKTLGAQIYCFKEFGPEQVPLLEPLASFGYFSAASLPACRMDLPWRSFDEYLGSLRAGYRRQIRCSARAAGRNGLTFQVVDDFCNHAAPIEGLYGQVMDRAEFQLERLNVEFFQRLNRNLPSETKALLATHDGKLVGMAILLISGGHATFLLVGFDYATNRQLHVYPNLVTRVVAEAIRSGAHSIELGQTSYYIKARHGGTTAARTIFVRHRSPIFNRLLRAGRSALFPERVFDSQRVFRCG